VNSELGRELKASDLRIDTVIRQKRPGRDFLRAVLLRSMALPTAATFVLFG
jgi:hypothetical protein